MTVKRAILVCAVTATFFGPTVGSRAEEPFVLDDRPRFVAAMCPPRTAADALNAYMFYLHCDRAWRKIGAIIREEAFAECILEQKTRGVPDLQRQTANCNEIYANLERE